MQAVMLLWTKNPEYMKYSSTMRLVTVFMHSELDRTG